MAALSGKVQTVLGPVDPSRLGFVQPHEHLFVNLVPPNLRDLKGDPIRMEDLGLLRRNWISNPENLYLDDEEDAIYEMGRFRESGGGTIVDQTIQGLMCLFFVPHVIKFEFCVFESLCYKDVCT